MSTTTSAWLEPRITRAAMHDHELERHRQRGLEAMHHHAERVADQNEVHIFVGDGRGMGVIGGQRDDRLAALARADIGCGGALEAACADMCDGSPEMRAQPMC